MYWFFVWLLQEFLNRFQFFTYFLPRLRQCAHRRRREVWWRKEEKKLQRKVEWRKLCNFHIHLKNINAFSWVREMTLAKPTSDKLWLKKGKVTDNSINPTFHAAMRLCKFRVGERKAKHIVSGSWKRVFVTDWWSMGLVISTRKKHTKKYCGTFLRQPGQRFAKQKTSQLSNQSRHYWMAENVAKDFFLSFPHSFFSIIFRKQCSN